jgi:hypothetical protein
MNRLFSILAIYSLLISCQSKRHPSEVEIIDSIATTQRAYIDSVNRWPPKDDSLRNAYMNELVEMDSLIGAINRLAPAALKKYIERAKAARKSLDSLNIIHRRR